jgi:hypothetical protein
LSDHAQQADGGWPIWEYDANAQLGSDLVCSGYALILLDFFAHRSADPAEAVLLKNRLAATERFFLEHLDKGALLWLDPRGGYLETYQMSSWYFSLMREPLSKVDPRLDEVVITALAEILKVEPEHPIRSEPLFHDVYARVASLILHVGPCGTVSHRDAAVEAFASLVTHYQSLKWLSTYALTRLLILLTRVQEAQHYDGSPPEQAESRAERITHLLGAFVGSATKYWTA